MSNINWFISSPWMTLQPFALHSNILHSPSNRHSQHSELMLKSTMYGHKTTAGIQMIIKVLQRSVVRLWLKERHRGMSEIIELRSGRGANECSNPTNEEYPLNKNSPPGSFIAFVIYIYELFLLPQLIRG